MAIFPGKFSVFQTVMTDKGPRGQKYLSTQIAGIHVAPVNMTVKVEVTIFFTLKPFKTKGALGKT